MTPSRASFAAIGLAYLENAILDALGNFTSSPRKLASRLGLYPGVRVPNGPAGTQIVRAILVALEEEKRVQSSGSDWRLTDMERSRRSW